MRDDSLNKLIFEHKYTVEDYITFSIAVKSGEFSGISNFCISRNVLKDAIMFLDEMYNNLEGIYQVNDYDSDDFILFEFLSKGHIKISGQLGGSHNEQYLKYQFITDQTELNNIINNFKGIGM